MVVGQHPDIDGAEAVSGAEAVGLAEVHGLGELSYLRLQLGLIIGPLGVDHGVGVEGTVKVKGCGAGFVGIPVHKAHNAALGEVEVHPGTCGQFYDSFAAQLLKGDSDDLGGPGVDVGAYITDVPVAVLTDGGGQAIGTVGAVNAVGAVFAIGTVNAVDAVFAVSAVETVGAVLTVDTVLTVLTGHACGGHIHGLPSAAVVIGDLPIVVLRVDAQAGGSGLGTAAACKAQGQSQDHADGQQEADKGFCFCFHTNNSFLHLVIFLWGDVFSLCISSRL